MTKIHIVAILIGLIVIFGIVRMQIWWHQEIAKGHHLAIASPHEWSFYSTQGETQVMCPSGQAECNRVYEMHQYGPINDTWEYWDTSFPPISRKISEVNIVPKSVVLRGFAAETANILPGAGGSRAALLTRVRTRNRTKDSRHP